MNLPKEDIDTMEVIGKSQKGEIIHVLTKGGLSLIVQKSLGGELKIVSTGNLPAIARSKASSLDKTIKYNDSLYKTEDMSLAKTDGHESTPENHLAYAKYQSQMAGKALSRPAKTESDRHDNMMRDLMHTDEAHKHYQMAGLDGLASGAAHKANKELHHEIPEDHKHPQSGYQLQLNFQKQNPSKRVTGLGYNWSK